MSTSPATAPAGALNVLRAIQALSVGENPDVWSEDNLARAGKTAAKAQVFTHFEKGLRRLGSADLPEAFVQQSDDINRTTVTTNRMVLSVADVASHALQDAGIPHVLINGPMMQAELYGTPFIRPAVNFDIVVKRRHYAATLAVLHSSDFRTPPSGSGLLWEMLLGERHLTHPDLRGHAIGISHSLRLAGSPQMRDAAEVLVGQAHRVDVQGFNLPIVHPKYLTLLSSLSIVNNLFARRTAAPFVVDLFTALGANTPANSRRIETTRALAEHHGIEGSIALALAITSAVMGPIKGAPALPARFDSSIQSMVFAPETVRHWPRRRAILSAVCHNRPQCIGEALRSGATLLRRRKSVPANPETQLPLNQAAPAD